MRGFSFSVFKIPQSKIFSFSLFERFLISAQITTSPKVLICKALSKTPALILDKTVRKSRLVQFWRRWRDSNSRYPFEVYTISNRARSTSYATSPNVFHLYSERYYTSPPTKSQERKSYFSRRQVLYCKWTVGSCWSGCFSCRFRAHQKASRVVELKKTPVKTVTSLVLRACLKSSNKDGDESKSKHLSRNKEFSLTIFPKSAEFVEPAK